MSAFILCDVVGTLKISLALEMFCILNPHNVIINRSSKIVSKIC
jgi:hypothetical protein